MSVSFLHIKILWCRKRLLVLCYCHISFMMTSSNRNIFRVTGPLCGEFTGPGESPTQRPVTRSFDVFFDLRLNKRLSKQPNSWWFETPSWSLWHHCNGKSCTGPFEFLFTLLADGVGVIPYNYDAEVCCWSCCANIQIPLKQVVLTFGICHIF